MSYLSLKALSFKLGDFDLKNITFDVNEGEYFVILGHSGAGKTVILESIAGLHNIDGEVHFDNENITKLTPEQRDIGFVYQDFALFPNMNVRDNITFAAKYRKIDNQKELLEDLIEFLGLQKIIDRRIDNLSGGEKQRVAIARAIFAQPKILLLDEPLSAIDPTFRNAIMKFLKEIHKKYNLTTLHVTHNFREASYLADKIAIVINGEVVQVDHANNVLSRPASLEVAEFLGFKNIFDASLISEEKGRMFSIDPNEIRVSSSNDLPCDYTFSGVMDECMGIVDHFKLFVDVGECQFFIKVLKREHANCSIDKGQRLYIGFDRKDVSFI